VAFAEALARFGVPEEAAQPGMQTLPRHPDLVGYLGHRITDQHRQDGLIPLLHDRHSHQCQSRLPDRVLPANNTRSRSRTVIMSSIWWTPVSSISRDGTRCWRGSL